MLSTMFDLLAEKRDWFFDLLLQHVGISLVSIGLAAVIGLALGIAIAQWRRGAKPMLALVNFVYTIPSIALFGFLIPVTGIGNLTAIVALTIYALLPMVRNTYTGLTSIEPAVIEAARGMGSTDRQLLYRIELPLAAPVIMSGVRNMATMTIALAGIASFIGAGGLGVAIYRGITTNNPAMTLAGSVLIAALAIAVDLLLGLMEKRTRRHLEPRKQHARAGAAGADASAAGAPAAGADASAAGAPAEGAAAGASTAAGAVPPVAEAGVPAAAAPPLGTGGVAAAAHARANARSGTHPAGSPADTPAPTPDWADAFWDDGEVTHMPEFPDATGWETRRQIASALTPRRRGITVAALVLALAVVGLGAFAFANRDGGGADASAGTITIATKPMTEQYIISEMLNTLIERDTNLEVELVEGIGGGTYNIQAGMESGEFDMYPEYTGTAWNTVLKREGFYDESLFGEMQQAYKDQLGFEWVGMYGFNNTFGIAVRKDVADRYNLHTYSDLAAAAPQLTFGAQPDFYDRGDGYPGLQEAYGMDFGTTSDMDMSLKYQALFEGQVDAITISTTDGLATDERLVVLEDDRHFYPSYLCGNVVRQDTLQQHPELRDELMKLDGAISETDIATMNNQVETQGQEPKAVADAFLAERGLM